MLTMGSHQALLPSVILTLSCAQVGAVSALPKIITTGFRSIQLIYFFTAGEDEVKCWQIRKASKAPQVI